MSPPTKQLVVKTNRTLFFSGNRNGHHNTEHSTQRHIKGQQQQNK
jgi:hypothetical protein